MNRFVIYLQSKTVNWNKNYYGGVSMKKYECPCGYVYDPAVGDPDNGVAPGTAWEDVPADWTCPNCGLDKDSFSAI